MVAAGSPFPIDELAAAFGLDRFVRDTLILALAPELDPGVSRLFAYAQDDATSRQATAALALELFASDRARAGDGAPDRAADVFGPYGPLTRLAFVQRTDGHLGGAATRPLRLDPRVAWYLRGVDDPGSFVGFALRHLEPAPIPVEFATSAASVASALDRGAVGGRPPVVNLVGTDERSSRALAGAIAARVGMRLHILSIQEGPGGAGRG